MRTLVTLGLLALATPAVASPDPATEITPIAISGPYRTLAESCKAARPCGFTDMDNMGNEIKPAKQPGCDAVIDPSVDIVNHVPDSISKSGGQAKMTHKVGTAEIRIGGVSCSVPKGLRREHSEYYVFVKRADGWWRTTTPMFEYDYNDKYCGGGLYIGWNDKPTRTIAGVAAMGGCLACRKQASSETIVELMLRVETTGDKPAVFPFLPVGLRSKTTLFDGPVEPVEGEDCKASASAVSMKEKWPSDDEVVLDGPGIVPLAAMSPLTLDAVVPETKPGTYRFKR